MVNITPASVGMTPEPLSPVSLKIQVEQALEGFFNALDGHLPVDLYQLVIREVEEPLLRKTLQHTQHNQVKAAQLLGLNRGTLRKKMELYDIR